MKNKKGFTLIELLAVITIMGILMMVAIPAVSRTIENSRRDTFGDVALNYVNVVRNAALADELKCSETSDGKGTGTTKKYAALKDGIYVFYVATSADAITADKFATGDGNPFVAANIVQATTDLMESGGKSSWGGNDVYGYVVWKKIANQNTANIETTYAVFLRDVANHGMNSMVLEENLTRSSISSTLKLTGDNPPNKATLDTPLTGTQVFGGKKNGNTTDDEPVNYVCILE